MTLTRTRVTVTAEDIAEGHTPPVTLALRRACPAGTTVSVVHTRVTYTRGIEQRVWYLPRPASQCQRRWLRHEPVEPMWFMFQVPA